MQQARSIFLFMLDIHQNHNSCYFREVPVVTGFRKVLVITANSCETENVPGKIWKTCKDFTLVNMTEEE